MLCGSVWICDILRLITYAEYAFRCIPHPIRSCFRVFMHTCGWSILRSVTPMLNPSIVHSIHMLVFVDVLLVFVCVCDCVCALFFMSSRSFMMIGHHRFGRTLAPDAENQLAFSAENRLAPDASLLTSTTCTTSTTRTKSTAFSTSTTQKH